MFYPSRALTSMKAILCNSAKAAAVAVETYLYDFKSDLFLNI